MFEPLLDTIPSEFDIDGIGGRPTVTIPLAVSEDGYQWVALEVRLWPCHWRGVACHEFKFAIIHFDHEVGEPAVIFDRNMVAGYIESVRRFVMPLVCAAARSLIDAVQPDVIYRATYVCRPAQNALAKHHMVTEAIENLGYKTAQSETDGHGRVFWVMTRNGDK